MKINQKGFSAVEGLLILVVVGMLGGVGWYVYDSNKETNDTYDSVAKTSTSPESTVEEIKPAQSAGWKKVESKDYKISFSYPNEKGWTGSASNTDSKTPIYEDGDRYSAIANYSLCGRNCGLAFNVRVLAKGSKEDPGVKIGDIAMEDNDFYKLISKKIVSLGGMTGTRWGYAPGDDSASNIVYYYFTDDDYAYHVTINGNGSKAENIDITKMGDEIASTIIFIK